MNIILILTIIGVVVTIVIPIFTMLYQKRQKNNEWMKINVYTRLYDWIVSRENTFRFNDEYVYADQTTLQLASSQYSMLDKKIKEKFDAFVNEGEKWDKMWSSVSVRFERRDTGIFNDFIQPLKDSNIINPNGYIIDLVNLDSFLTQFLFVFINPSINNAETLYQKMKEYAEKKNISELQHLEEIKKKRAKFFELINKNLPELRRRLLLEVNYNNLMEQANKARHTLSELRVSLKNKL